MKDVEASKCRFEYNKQSSLAEHYSILNFDWLFEKRIFFSKGVGRLHLSLISNEIQKREKWDTTATVTAVAAASVADMGVMVAAAEAMVVVVVMEVSLSFIEPNET